MILDVFPNIGADRGLYLGMPKAYPEDGAAVVRWDQSWRQVSIDYVLHRSGTIYLHE